MSEQCGRLSDSLVAIRLSFLLLTTTIRVLPDTGLVTMDPLQNVVLQASWRTMVAHGVPSITNRESATTKMVDTVLTIAKEASDTFKNVPCITAFAGIIIQIISIREVRELSRELTDLP
jgi:hypothetical protein